MKKMYKEPQLQVELLDCVDILTDSFPEDEDLGIGDSSQSF